MRLFETRTTSFLPWFSRKTVWVNKDHWTKYLNPSIFLAVLFLIVMVLNVATRCIPEPEPIIQDRIILGNPGKVF